MAAAVARVMVDSPLPQLDRLFDYGVPAQLASQAVAGVRVRVPLRSAGRVADGYIVEVVESADYSGALSDLESVVSPIRVLTPEVWALARRAADRAAGSATDIVRLAVPGRQVRVEKAYLADESNEAIPVVTAVPVDGYGSGVIESALAANERLAVDAPPLVQVLPDGVWVGGWAVCMARAAASVVQGGRTAILAVPDYRDQEQLESALRAVLPADCVVRLDARQPNPDRYRAFLRCLSDRPLAIVGNRSVVYAPAANLGLIALWDDGDPLYSEPLAPYVYARDAALLRQEQQDCALMFLGHSRSTEVERLVELGWLRSISPVPLVLPKIVPTANQAAGDRLAAQARIPSAAWRVAREALATGPVLVQVSRPGYAPSLACVDCNQTARCERCEGPLAQKSSRSVPACLWCGALAAQWHCSNCGGE
ncbi:MAG: primosomal protein N', partial [Rhodoglobus sp.]